VSSVLWFRRDLRLDDHPALAAAVAAGDVVGLYVIDPVLWNHSGAPRQAYLVAALRALNQAMGGSLVVRYGDPAVVVSEVAAAAGASEVFVTADHAPAGRRRDKMVNDALTGAHVRLVRVGSNYAVSPGTVKTGSGTSYAVFTPFCRTWRSVGWEKATEALDVDWQTLPSEPFPASPEVGFGLPFASPDAAGERLVQFAADGLNRYKTDRDTPALDGSSRLSAALRFGVLHPRTVLAATNLGTNDSDVFTSEIAWRDFYADVLFAKPETAWNNLQSKMNLLPRDTDTSAIGRFQRWCDGSTGYPIIDAGMRQLLATGWMHNRVRMIVASFLVKDLHLPWQWGAKHFMRYLVDGDIASNNHGWQWAAGTGTDAAPFFRVFNPVTQGERFDPMGDYVRRFIPELADIPDRHVHAPWRTAIALPAYPAPMVDHAEERVEALRRYSLVRGS
jgi:deoxyribodipyrimidine photo-lyase